MAEKTLKSYTEKGVRIQLVKITTEWGDTPGDAYTEKYQVRKNRKIRKTTEDYRSACELFQSIIYCHANQLKLF